MNTAKLGHSSGDANCDDCPWQTSGKNSLGNAAKHHYKTGHTVHAVIERYFTLADKNSKYYLAWLEMHKNDNLDFSLVPGGKPSPE